MQAKAESQEDWLDLKNQSRTQGNPFQKGQKVRLCKSEETLKNDNKLLPLWEGPFQVNSRLSDTTFNIEVEPARHQEVHRDCLKAEVPCPKLENLLPHSWHPPCFLLLCLVLVF